MNKIVTDFSVFEEGLQEVADLVASTIGPFGGNVSVAGGPHRKTFDDGFKAVESYQPHDVQKMEAVRRVYDALRSQLNSCGDGTSTTTLLLASLYFEGRKLVAAGHKERNVVRAFQALADRTCEELDRMAIKSTIDVNGQEKGDPDIISKVATIAMHGDQKLGRLIGELVADLGRYGMISAELGTGKDIEVSRSTGYAWKAGLPDQVFFNRPGAAQWGESLVVVVNESCDDIQTPFWNAVLESWLEICKRENKQFGLVLISRGATGSVMSTFARGTLAASGQKMPMFILKPPGETDAECVSMLNDIGEVTGARVFDKIRGNMAKGDFREAYFGRIDGFHATLGKSSLKLSDNIDAGLQQIDVEEVRKGIVQTIMLAMEENSGDQGYVDVCKKRIANLTGAVATIKFPSVSQTQFSELQEQVEDGYRSAMSALDGVLPGGGKALFNCANVLAPEKGSTDIQMAFANALCAPAAMLLKGVFIHDVRSEWSVIDIEANEVGNAVELGILDSLNVVKSALTNAMSVAMPLVNTKRWLVLEP